MKGNYSEATAREIDLEVRRIIDDCYAETERLLRNHNRLIHDLAEVLLINETVDAEEMEIVVKCYTDSQKNNSDSRDKESLKHHSAANDDRTEEIIA